MANFNFEKFYTTTKEVNMHIQPIKKYNNFNNINFSKRIVSNKGAHQPQTNKSKAIADGKAISCIPILILGALAGVSISPTTTSEETSKISSENTEPYSPEEPIETLFNNINNNNLEKSNKNPVEVFMAPNEIDLVEATPFIDEEIQPEDVISVSYTDIQNASAPEEATTTEAKYWLGELEKAGGDAYKYFYRLTNCLGFEDDIETMKYLCTICYSEEWGDGCTNPLYLCAQIMQESGYDARKIASATDAQGLVQQTPIAVREINRIYNTKYTYADRLDGKKSIEMAILLLKNNTKETGTIGKALGMYYTGLAKYSAGSDAREYISNILKRFDNPPMTTWELLEHRPDLY